MEIIPRKWAVIPFVFFHMVAMSTNFYIVPQLIITKVCWGAFNRTICSQLEQARFKAQENYVFNKAAEWNALFNFAGYFPATIITLPLGAMTDLVSKKKILLLPAIASLLSCLLHLCSSIFIKLSVGYQVLGNFFISTFGEVPGSITLCCAYAAASTTNEDRTFILTMVMASYKAGIGIGGLIGNYLKTLHGYPSVFLFAATSLTIELLYALALIPPTEDDENKHKRKERYDIWKDFKEHTKDTWFHLVSFIKDHIVHSQNKTLLLLLIVAFLNLASYGGERALITLFLKHSPLNFKAHQIGIFLALFELTRVVGLLVLALILNKYYQFSDSMLMLIATVSMIINYTVLSLSKTELMVYLSTVFTLPATFMSSALRSKLTKLVSTDEHAVSLSLFGVTDVLGELIMAVVANGFFIATAKVYSGFSILLMSCANFLALGILCFVYYTRDRKSTTDSDYQTVLKTENGNEQK